MSWCLGHAPQPPHVPDDPERLDADGALLCRSCWERWTYQRKADR
jgi:hypothetical protein